jgi:hypothetical protein
MSYLSGVPCNNKGQFTPCNYQGNPSARNIPLAASPLTQAVYFDEQFKGGVFPTANFEFFNFNGQGDNDGFVTANPNAPGIVVTAGTELNPGSFTQTNTSGLDHVKWLAYHNVAVPVRPGYEAVIEAKVAGQQIFSAIASGSCTGSLSANGLYPAAFDGYVRDAQEDIRLCGAALNSFDPTSLQVADFFFANNKGYAFYERLPFNKTATNDYWAFSHAIPVFERSGDDPINEFYTIQIVWTNTTVSWVVDGKVVYSVQRLGFPIDEKYRILNHGGTATPVTVDAVRGGFGLFTLLDMSLPDNYARQLGPQPLTNLNQVQGFNPANTAASPVGLVSLVDPLAVVSYASSYAPDYANTTGSFPSPNVAPQIGPSPVPTVNPISPNARAFLTDGTAPGSDCLRIWGQGAAIAVQYIKGFTRLQSL